ncbi:MAG: hypothetical protein IPL61_27465 [Myxococcales bacterium]|nr:hypothetical protein [Myxococcales bacterium]
MLRAYTVDVRKALFEAMDKGNEQLATAPARVRRVVVYLQRGTATDVAPFAATLQRYTRETGVIIEAVLPDGTRIISSGAVQ